jgi:hypothetical protein
MQPIHPEPVREVLPEGMLPFESTVIRAMRRAKLRAADHERARIVAWIRRQKAASWPDMRNLADAIKHGEHHVPRQGGTST